jgi:RNA polymerase sigma factor (sigma-70 family)
VIEPLVRERTAPEIDGLYRELQGPLVRFAEGMLGNRPDAEEAVQDAFAAAVRAGGLDEPRLWLFRVTRNAAIDQLRRRRRLVALEVVESAPSVGASLEQTAETAEDVALVRRGIDRLPVQQRTALLLRELAGCSYAEISQILDLTEANVKVVIFRARRGLQDFVEAVRLPCEDAQITLSAFHDGEASRASTARARLHATGCARCRGFGRTLTKQRAAIGLLVPLPPGDSLFSFAGSHLLHAVEGGGAGAAAGKGVIGGLIGAKAAATTACVVTLGAGAVLTPQSPVHGVLPGHPLTLPGKDKKKNRGAAAKATAAEANAVTVTTDPGTGAMVVEASGITLTVPPAPGAGRKPLNPVAVASGAVPTAEPTKKEPVDGVPPDEGLPTDEVPPVDGPTPADPIGGVPPPLGEEPVDEGGVPVDEGEAPVDEGEAPVDEGEAPVDEGETPPPVDEGDPGSGDDPTDDGSTPPPDEGDGDGAGGGGSDPVDEAPPPEDEAPPPPEDEAPPPADEPPPADGGDPPPEDQAPVGDPPAEEPPAEEPPAESPPADEPPAEEPPADTPPAEEPPADASPRADAPPADDAPPAETPPADAPPAEEPPADPPAV